MAVRSTDIGTGIWIGFRFSRTHLVLRCDASMKAETLDSSIFPAE